MDAGLAEAGHLRHPQGHQGAVLVEQAAGLHERPQAAVDLRQRARLSRAQPEEHPVCRRRRGAAHADPPRQPAEAVLAQRAVAGREPGQRAGPLEAVAAREVTGLSVEGIAKRYGAVVALDQVSLAVAAGEFLTI